MITYLQNLCHLHEVGSGHVGDKRCVDDAQSVGVDNGRADEKGKHGVDAYCVDFFAAQESGRHQQTETCNNVASLYRGIGT